MDGGIQSKDAIVAAHVALIADRSVINNEKSLSMVRTIWIENRLPLDARTEGEPALPLRSLERSGGE